MNRFLFLPFLLLSFFASAQPDPVKWTFELEPLENAEYLLRFKAKIAEKWHLYGQELPEDGPLPTVFMFSNEGEGFETLGGVKESEPITAFDSIFEMELQYFDLEATFEQRIKVTDPNLNAIEGEIEYQACDDKLCIFRTAPFRFSLRGDMATQERTIDAESAAKAAALKLDLKNTEGFRIEAAKTQDGGILTIFLLGMFGGFLALLTPCVFPMIPLTVSYFVKQQGPKGQGTVRHYYMAFLLF
jgi:thiol:disulfide interchange protein